MSSFNDKGVYKKYEVRRTDGRDEPGCKHHNCRLFVIDLDHDPFAEVALVEYAEACFEKMPLLSVELTLWLVEAAHERGEVSDRDLEGARITAQQMKEEIVRRKENEK